MKYVYSFLYLMLMGIPLLSAQDGSASFIETCREKKESSSDPRVVEGEDQWFFLKSELEHLTAGNPSWDDPMEAIVDFHQQLQDRGIELIFVPVPAKASVYPEKLDASLPPPGSNRLDSDHRQFYDLLEARGVTVLDLMPVMLNARSRGIPVYCRTDAHWTPQAIELAAYEIAGMVKEMDWYSEEPKQTLLSNPESITFSGDLVPEGTSSETHPVNTVRTQSQSFVSANEESPVILMGDSHTLIFHEGGDMLSQGTGLSDQLDYQLQMLVDLIGVRGSGATPSRVNLFRKSRVNPDYLQGKKVVVWCLSVREFTQSSGGWKIVPVGP